MKKKIVLLGATGSIGTQTLDILKKYPEKFELIGIGAGTSFEKLADLAGEFPSIRAISLSDENPERRKILQERGLESLQLFEGEEGAAQMIKALRPHMTVNAAVGFAGVLPSLASIEIGSDLALANKETLVAAGELVRKKMKDSPSKIYPIDSEHSAIWQALMAGEEAEKLLITASGGSLRNRSREELEDVTPAQALAHPNWAMGKRITIDSATMVNKAFEVIEAHYLFDMDYSRIETLLHPQSLIHSMVQFEDGSVMAQLGPSDMHEAIQLALFEGKRKPNEHRLDFSRMLQLDLLPMDFERFPMLKLGYEVGKRKGTAGAVFNAADEEAVRLFLEGKISFPDIERLVEKAVETIPFMEDPGYEDLRRVDRQARDFVRTRAGAGS